MLAILLSLHESDGVHGSADTDTVILSKNLVIQNQSIGVASSTQGFDDMDGILGWVLRPEESSSGALTSRSQGRSS